MKYILRLPTLANWDKLSFRFPLYLEDLTGNVKVIAFSPDGKQVLTSSDDKTARLWETNSGKLLSTLRERHRYWRYCSVFSRWEVALHCLTMGKDGVPMADEYREASL